MNRNCNKSLPVLFTVLICGALPSCALNQNWLEKQRAEELAAAKALEEASKPRLYEWKGAELQGQTAVKIVLDEQKAYFTVGGQDAGWSYLASGKSSHPSPTGNFRITEKIRHKSSNRYGKIVNRNGDVVDGDAKAGRESVPAGGRFVGAPMPYWMRLTGYGVGMHAGAIPNPGMPASHGCIRLPAELAAIVFDRFEVGTTVTITGSIPSYIKRPATPTPTTQPLASGTRPAPSAPASVAMSTLR